jgi:hypothetical protein
MSEKPREHWINRENPAIAREIDQVHEIAECRESRRLVKLPRRK